MNLKELYQELILEHGKNPRNLGKTDNFNKDAKGNNPLCGDNVHVYLKLNDQRKVEDISFEGSGCAISMASASIMTDLIKGKSDNEAKEIIEDFLGMIKENPELKTNLLKEDDKAFGTVEDINISDLPEGDVLVKINYSTLNYKDSLGLHADTQPSPNGKLPSEWVDACNSVLCLTDYTKDDGALAVVPYSHKIARQPSADDYKKSNVIPVEAPAGSLIFWHGNLWHGAFPKLTDGLRINLTTFMNHRRIKTQECIKEKVTQEMLDRNPGKHFARMVGLNDSNGFDQNGPVLEGIINYGTEDQMKRFTFNVKDYKKRNR